MARRQPPTSPPALVGGPYTRPDVKIGDWLWDEVAKERRYVDGWVDAPIRWPATDLGNVRVHIVCFDLVKALHQESGMAVQFYFGATESMVNRWRRALNVPRYNRGTAALYRERYAAKSDAMAQGLRDTGPISRGEVIGPGRIREIRRQLGISQSQLADKLWVSTATILAWEDGRRTPGGPERKLLGLLMEGKI